MVVTGKLQQLCSSLFYFTVICCYLEMAWQLNPSWLSCVAHLFRLSPSLPLSLPPLSFPPSPLPPPLSKIVTVHHPMICVFELNMVKYIAVTCVCWWCMSVRIMLTRRAVWLESLSGIVGMVKSSVMEVGEGKHLEQRLIRVRPGRQILTANQVNYYN